MSHHSRIAPTSGPRGVHGTDAAVVSVAPATGARCASGRRGRLTLLAALVLALLAWAVPAAQADVGGFEGGDGDQTSANCATALDWSCLSASQIDTFLDPTANDYVFIGTNNKENQPDSWDIGAGTVGTPKADILGAWAYSYLTGGHNYVDMAFNRANGSGDSYIALELNQRGDKYVNTVGSPVTCRSNGDVVIAFDVSPTTPVPVSVNEWQWISGTPCTAGATGDFSKSVTLPTGAAELSLNTSTIQNFLSTSAVGTSFATGTFGKAAIDLTALANAVAPAATCEFYNHLQITTRASSSLTSELQDIVEGDNIAARSCQTSGGGGGGGGTTCTGSALPNVQISSPADEFADKTSTVTLSGTTDQSAPNEVELLDGSTVVGNAPITAGSWTLTLNGVADGAHAYSAVVTDMTTNRCSNTSNLVHVNVDTSSSSGNGSGTGSGTGSGGTAGFVASSGAPGAVPASRPAGASGPGAAQAALACTNRKLVLTDVLQRGRRVLLAGAADASLIGHKVKILFNDRKRVATATVGRDGLFTTTAPLPSIRLRNSNSARYLAVSGRLKSLDLKLTRRLILVVPTSQGGKVTLAGTVTRPLAKPTAVVFVQQRISCSRTITVAHFKPGKSGAFKITINAPAGHAAAIYRLTTRVRKTTRSRKLFPTFSLPEPVALH